MKSNLLSLVLSLAASIALASELRGANTITWNIDLFTTGNDVFWTSPTQVTLGLPEYDWAYEVTKLSATTILGEHDLLGELGDAALGSGTTTSLPIVLWDEFLEEENTGSSATLRIEVDENGFGRASGTDITLGSVLIIPIQRVDLEAIVTLIGIPNGDYDRDGDVDIDDYDIWRNDFGSTTSLDADGNRNSIVDAADYTVWRDNLASGLPGAASIGAVPEPSSFVLMALSGVFLWGVVRRQSSG